MLSFVTTNPGKVREATAYLDDDVEQFDFDYPEIQADDLAAVAAHGARSAYRAADGPVVVDDAGLFVDAFDGFPGPYSSYVEDTVGVERVWRMTEPETDRSAAFKTVIAYCDGDPLSTDRGHEGSDDEAPVALFEGRVDGTIVAPRGDGGFGFDPIFEHEGATFAEMSTDEKNAVSHRGRALESFAEWYADR
ncbi:RdgB/HAM1 family non-canonical purine NTP pyrophosphatase [Haloarcula montana]|uniref:RdgB/HAM1 family non-canonical purine NTP pyrophosphatase n=1 Tax=Haloarcula montana TaxID=3111776 RepID=UPI002D787CCA|nr:RdgB/HAM1 family non-canonical purine NTP pyrophosphatase [Haloarcula sp. GH36]